MNKFNKSFKKREFTVESMIDITSGCSCYCGTTCPCNTTADYAAYSGSFYYATSYNKTPASTH